MFLDHVRLGVKFSSFDVRAVSKASPVGWTTTAHYYANAGTFTVKLEMIDTDGNGEGVFYTLARHTVPAQTVETQLAAEAADVQEPFELEPYGAVVSEPLGAFAADEIAAAILFRNTCGSGTLSTSGPSFESSYVLSPETAGPLPGVETSVALDDSAVFDSLDLGFINDETVGDYTDDCGEPSDLETSAFDEDEIAAVI